jgi:hypothetical protein
MRAWQGKVREKAWHRSVLEVRAGEEKLRVETKAWAAAADHRVTGVEDWVKVRQWEGRAHCFTCWIWKDE